MPDKPNTVPFFTKKPRQVLTQLLLSRPGPRQLLEVLISEEAIDRAVRGTECELILKKNSPEQRNGVLGELEDVVPLLRLLPEAGTPWTATNWARSGQGILFITSVETSHSALLPLMRLWIELLIARAMEEGAKGNQAKTWFILDELASLQKLPSLVTAMTLARKRLCPFVLGLQGRSQLNAIYGELAETILSQPALKVMLGTKEPEAAMWVSKVLGEAKIERVEQTVTKSSMDRRSRSTSIRTQTTVEPVAIPAQIKGLANLHGFIKVSHMVVPLIVPFSLPVERVKNFIERKLEPWARVEFTPIRNYSRRVDSPIATPSMQTNNSTNDDWLRLS